MVLQPECNSSGRAGYLTFAKGLTGIRIDIETKVLGSGGVRL